MLKKNAAFKATVTKILTNDEFVRISKFLRIPEFADKGHSFVRPPFNSQEQLEAFLRKWSVFWSYDGPIVRTFFVRVPWDLPTAYLRPSYDFVVIRWSYGTPMCISRYSQIVGRKILRLSAYFSSKTLHRMRIILYGARLAYMPQRTPQMHEIYVLPPYEHLTNALRTPGGVRIWTPYESPFERRSYERRKGPPRTTWGILTITVGIWGSGIVSWP